MFSIPQYGFDNTNTVTLTNINNKTYGSRYAVLYEQDVKHKAPCESLQHNVPAILLTPSIYTHVCPACGETVQFTIFPVDDDQ